MMKNKVTLFSILSLFFVLTGCASDVTSYNNALVDFQKVCYEADDKMLKAWNDENYGQTKTLLAIAKETCKESQKGIVQMLDWNGDASLRDAFNEEMLIELEYLAKIEEGIAYWNYEELTKEQDEAENAIWDEVEALDAKFNEASKKSEQVQAVFADKYGYELED